MKKVRFVIILFFIISSLSFAYALEEKKAMLVFVNIPILLDNSDDKIKQMKQLTDFIKKDLKRKFRKLYTISIMDESSISKDEGLTLVYDIVKYNPGSAAARFLVGFGAGTCSLDIKYKVLKDNELILSKEDGCASSRGWQACINKLNKNLYENLKIVSK